MQLQISEVVNSMKDLIDYSRETRTGPMGKSACVPFYLFLMLAQGFLYLPINLKDQSEVAWANLSVV